MTNSIVQCELHAGIDELKSYVTANYGKKSVRHYSGVLDGLKDYAANAMGSVSDIIGEYYEKVTLKPPFQHPETAWRRHKARTLLMLTDILAGSEPKREYYYNKTTYSGVFKECWERYSEWLLEIDNNVSSLRTKKSIVIPFLRYLDSEAITGLSNMTVEHVLSYLNCCSNNTPNRSKRTAYILRNFLNSPKIRPELTFDPVPPLSGYRNRKNTRLASFYTPDELKLVMDSVDRTTKWGKTIYAMMLFAVAYGLRVSDIREMKLSSINWQKRVVSLNQKKTGRFVELPLIDEVKFAVLDYLKNVRPKSDDPHIFLRHLHPHIPYSEKDNFGSKVSAFFEKSGVNTENKHHGFHSMRTSLATDLLADGVPINEIAPILGHATIVSTEQYVWSDIKHLKAAALEVPKYGN
ncbi:MAG: tyrosine-type recombinase/integrase [Oscillospiraceae bacterium]|nr:tyrosine-type recombinase/integrase [Oscillospiraceae bacterium]